MDKKLTLLERYYMARHDFENGSKSAPPPPARLWVYQELLYRIQLLDAMQLIAKAAPLSIDMKQLSPHFQVVNRILENIRTERFLKSPAAETQKQQQAAAESLNSVIGEFRKRFSSYAPASAEQYQKDIQRSIATILPAWIQYRNTITDIKVNIGEAA